MRRGISEKSVKVLNPLPRLADAAILEKAGLADTAEAFNHTPLDIDWQYSGGDEREFVRLAPGASQILRASDAAVMMRECGERGLAMVQLTDNEETVEKACDDAIKRAILFYSDRGNKRLQNIRKRFGLTKEEMEENKHEHWSFHYNQAISDLLRAELNKAPAKKRAAKE